MNPKNLNGYRIGIVNPTTLVGNEIKTILRDRSFPYERLVLLDSTGESAGALTDIGDEPAVVTPVTEHELSDLDLVFFCGPPAGNSAWIERAADAGLVVIDLSQPTTIEGVKPVVAGINLEELTAEDKVVVSPHPVAIPIVLILRQIASAIPIASCIATVVQPASQFEQAGVEELARQTISVLNIQSVPKEVFDRQLAFNLYPASERLEEFVVGQVRELVDPRTELALLITQGTVFHGHTFSLFIRAKKAVATDAVVDALKKSAVMAFPEGDQAFGTIDAAGRDEILIADVRADPSIEGGVWVWAVCDNLRRSSALNAVLVAEKVLFGTTAPN